MKCFGAVLAVGLMAMQSVAAQPTLSSVAAPLRGPDITTQYFGSSSGLLSGTVYSATRGPAGRLWIGTDDGVYSLEGSQWHAQPMPDGQPVRQVRVVRFDASGGKWYGMRSGAFRFANNSWTAYTQAEGVPGRVVYSIAETRAIDGTPRIVLGAANGICVIEGERCRVLPVPLAIGQVAFMVASATSSSGIDELWIISATGGAARFRQGTWTTFAEAQGLSRGTAEDIATVTTATGVHVVVVGSAGVFELQRNRNGEERFVVAPRSPRDVYRVSYIRQPRMPAEVWIGTNAGNILRRRGTTWDTLTMDGERMRGQVTMLFADTTNVSVPDVFVGSRGDRLTRVSLAAALRLNLPGRASRDWVHTIAQLRDGPNAGSAVIGMNAAGATLVDRTGQARLLNDPTDLLLYSTAAVYWGPLDEQRPTQRPETDVPQLVVLSSFGPVWFPAGRAEVMPLSDTTTFRRLRYVKMFDSTSVLLGASTNGILEWRKSKWVPSERFPNVSVTDVMRLHDDTLQTIYATAHGGVYAFKPSGFQFDSMAGLGPSAAPWLTSICETQTADGPLVFVAGERGTLAWRRHGSAGPWQRFPRLFARNANGSRPAVVSCDAQGRVFVGSARGLLIARIPGADTAAWTIDALVSRESGLPSNEVTAIGVPTDNRLWVGTEYGVAIVDLDRTGMPPLAPMAFRVTESVGGGTLADGDVLPPTHDQLRIDVWMNSRVRESDSQFDIQWRRIRPWTRFTSKAEPAQWSNNVTRYITDISPGTYQLTLRGRDFVGRESPAVVWRIVVQAPWWRSWFAVLAYVLIALAVGRWLYQWRINVLRRGTAALVTSEQRLRASEGRFRALFDHAQDAHLLVDRGVVVRANAMATSLFGVPTHDALVGRAIDDLIPGWSREHGPVVTESSNTIPMSSPEVTIARQDHSVPVQLTSTTIRIDDGEIWHIVLRDLTAVRAAEREQERVATHLRERQRLESLGTLAGGIAHDFNNLLGVIRGNAELAEGSVHEPLVTLEHLESIVDASDRARDLVRQILTFSHGPLPEQSLVDLSELVQSLLPLLRRMIPSNVHIELVGVNAPHVISGDATQLQQVLLNLVSNAEHAMRAHSSGLLTIGLFNEDLPVDGASPVGAVVRLMVRDSGVGMSPEVQARVFEPFFTTKATGDGTGLGLAVLHGVVQAHSGRVQFESSEGHGTTAHVYFPAASATLQAPSSSRSPTPVLKLSAVSPLPTPDVVTVAARSGAASARPLGKPPSPFVGARLVVVDDELAVARVVERALTRSGYVVRVFTDSNEALKAISDDPLAVDLVLTDQTMPVVTGDVLTEALHQVAPLLPVLILTGFSHRLTPERIAEVGALAVLQKPIDLESLKQAVEMALKWSEVHRGPVAQ